MDEQERRQEAEKLRFDANRVRAFKEMQNTEGWKLFCELINGRIGEYTADIFEKPKPLEERGEVWQKGACYGLIWARDLPTVTIAAFNSENSDPATEESEQ